MAPLSLMTTTVGWLAKSFSVLSCKSSLSRCTSILPSAYITPVKCLTTAATGPPKRPLNSYIRYYVQQRPILIRQNPDISAVDVAKKIGQQWKSMTPEQRRPFQEATLKQLAQFKADYMVYKSKLTPAELQKEAQERIKRIIKKKSFRKKRELNVMGKPKRPRTAFNIYVSEHYNEAKGTTAPVKMLSLYREWRNLFNHQKQVYIQLAEDDKIRYKNEMKSWEDHMMDIGRDDLVREQTLSQKKKKAKTALKKRSGTRITIQSTKKK